MELKYGFISADDHVQEHPDVWTERMSKAKWGDRIPHIERAGIELRHQIGMNNIMWESDFPHSTSTYPESRKFVDRILEGVPQNERDQLCYGNATRLYSLS